jgi:hypothetical protein
MQQGGARENPEDWFYVQLRRLEMVHRTHHVTVRLGSRGVFSLVRPTCRSLES